LLLSLLGIAISGGMFVVPLYAFLTTVVDKAETARTIAANNIVNAGAMVVGSLIAVGLSAAGVALADQLLLGAAMCLIAAWLGRISALPGWRPAYDLEAALADSYANDYSLRPASTPDFSGDAALWR
jgi:MFS family permease